MKRRSNRYSSLYTANRDFAEFEEAYTAQIESNARTNRPDPVRDKAKARKNVKLRVKTNKKR